MFAADVAIKLDMPFGALDYALLERIVSEACHQAGLPVVDVEIDGLRAVDAPLPAGVPPLNPYPVGPSGAPVVPAPGQWRG